MVKFSINFKQCNKIKEKELLFFMSEEKENEHVEDLDNELDKQWALQDQIHHKCKMRDDPEVKQKKWDETHE